MYKWPVNWGPSDKPSVSTLSRMYSHFGPRMAFLGCLRDLDIDAPKPNPCYESQRFACFEASSVERGK